MVKIEIKGNKLYLGGVKAERLVKEFGSPLYAYEEETIRMRFNELRNAISYPDLRVYYACKANTNIEIMRILKEEGSYLDAVSPGEMFLGLKAGFPSNKILFTGSNCTDEDFRYCIENNILANLGSISQIRRYGRLNPDSDVVIRINPDVGAGHHKHTITGGPDSKFGIYFDKVDGIKKEAKKYGLNIIGIHQHIGSGILDAGIFIGAADILLKTAKEFNNLDFVDFGGGIGVPYRPREKPIDVNELGNKISKRFNDFCSEYGKKLILAIEPGRYLVAESGFLLATANNIKETPKHKFAGTDTGFNHLIRPAMYCSHHEIINASNAEGEKEKYVIAGNLCESGDIFTRNEYGPEGREIPGIKEGDVLAVCNAGAYGFSMSSNYNSRPKPAEVIVGKKKARLIRKRESLQDFQ
ncbi:diaminopimelate decarboxylase [Candidatus Woesearchaeota archaeon]|nr:diaminopimelate decarboxylase [Candidatus Woesearchaeota archaeon]